MVGEVGLRGSASGDHQSLTLTDVIPAKAGILFAASAKAESKTPAFAGVTPKGVGRAVPTDGLLILRFAD